jgi:hypothetical protein
VPYDDGTGDKTSSFPDALWSFFCF